MVRIGLAVVCLGMLTAARAAAQDQTIIVDQPLAACTPQVKTATLTSTDAAAIISGVLKGPDPDTYYIIHATEFAPGRNTIAEERWYVYHAGWDDNPSVLDWLADSRQAKRFRETRIMGSDKVSLVYVYVNVPAYSMLASRNDIVAHYRRQQANAKPLSPDDRTALEARIRSSLDQTAEDNADAAAGKAVKAAAEAAKADATKPVLNPDVEEIVQLETERYLKSFGDGANKSVTDELPIIDRNTGEALVGLSPTLATTTTFAPLNSLFYKVAVTKKTPAPIENLKAATKFAFSGQADAATPLYVDVRNIAVCAGGNMSVKHVPSDLLVTAFNKNAKDEEVQRSKQQFDNEGKYWWDVSFALPLESHNDLKVDVDAGQVAAKQVEKTDLFAVINLGIRRDTKKIQWQLVPSFIYGMPITAQPLKHHLVGFSLGLNYVQLIGGWRFDRRTQVATGEQNGTPVGIEATPEGDRWEDANWTWALNIPVQTIIKLFQKDAKK